MTPRGPGGPSVRIGPSRQPRLLALAALLSLAAVGAALITQHVYGMQPCPWCVLQRLIFLVMAVAALPGLVLRSPWARRLSAAAVAGLALAGAAAALWQHFVAASSASCNLTLADRVLSATGLDERFPQVFAAYASCADAKVNLAGLPYEFWSLALFILLGAMASRTLLTLRVLHQR
jgi:protein dithiol:quinone oxidoreductase